MTTNEAHTAENGLPQARVEYRVRAIFKDYPLSPPPPHTHQDDWSGSDVDGAAAYPWLMNTCIAWVEQRVVYDPEPWEPADVDSIIPPGTQQER